MGSVNWSFAVGEVGVEAGSLVTPVELVEPYTLE